MAVRPVRLRVRDDEPRDPLELLFDARRDDSGQRVKIKDRAGELYR